MTSYSTVIDTWYTYNDWSGADGGADAHFYLNQDFVSSDSNVNITLQAGGSADSFGSSIDSFDGWGTHDNITYWTQRENGVVEDSTTYSTSNKSVLRFGNNANQSKLDFKITNNGTDSISLDKIGFLFRNPYTAPSPTTLKIYLLQNRADDNDSIYLNSLKDTNGDLIMTPQSGTTTTMDTQELTSTGVLPAVWTSAENAGRWIQKTSIGYLDPGLHAIFRIELSGNKTGGSGFGMTLLDLLTIEMTQIVTSTSPSIPSSLTASAIAFEAISLTWTAPSETVTGYKIERRTSLSSFQVLTSDTNSTSTTYNDTSVGVGGIEYYYRVSAINSVGTSGATNEVSATTLTVMGSLQAGTNINAIQIAVGGDSNDAIKNRLSYLKETGFDHVRIGYRMNKKDNADNSIYLFEVFDSNSGEYTHINRYLDIVNSALNEGFTVVIDPVHYEESSTNLVSADELIALWDRIITEISSYSFDDSNLKNNIIFEIINEPRTIADAAYDPNTNYVGKITLATIFSIINTIHNTFSSEPYCIFSGFDFNTHAFKNSKGSDFSGTQSNGGALSTAKTLIDEGTYTNINTDKLIATFHYYEPRSFTNYGVVSNGNLEYSGTWENILSDVNTVITAVETYNTSNFKMYVGEIGSNWHHAESGSLSDTASNMYKRYESNRLFLSVVADRLRDTGHGVCLWESFPLAHTGYRKAIVLNKPTDNWYNNDITFDSTVNGLDTGLMDVFLGNVVICFYGFVNIITDQGLKQIKDLKRGDMILTNDGFQPLAELDVGFNPSDKLLMTKKKSTDFMVKIPKDFFIENVPSEDVYVTKTHPLSVKITSLDDDKDFEFLHLFVRELMQLGDGIEYVRKESETKLYNLIFDNHYEISVGNMKFLSHHPNHNNGNKRLEEGKEINSSYRTKKVYADDKGIYFKIITLKRVLKQKPENLTDKEYLAGVLRFD